MQNGQASSRATSPSAEIAPGAILEQLDRICASREFHATPRMRAFLRFCVEEALAGRSDQLKGYTIAMQVFDRGEDFDPAQDPVVRIQAGRLRRALERYYLVAGGQDPVVIDIPKDIQNWEGEYKGQGTLPLPGPPDTVESLAFTADSSALVIGTRRAPAAVAIRWASAALTASSTRTKSP